MSKLRLYYYTSWKHGIEAIQKQRLKLSDINLVNDPNELSAYYTNQEFIDDSIKMYKDQIAGFTGMLSLSKEPQCPLMWGHYGENHKGLCLGLDVNEDLAREVIYIDEKKYLSKEALRETDLEDLLLKNLHAKSSDWKYEQEYRIIRRNNESEWCPYSDLYFMKLDDNIELIEVVLGIRTIKDHEYINNLLKYIKHDKKIFTSKVSKSLESFKFKKSLIGFYEPKS